MSVDGNRITPQARALGATLREVREHSGVSGRDLAKRLALSHSTISHWENARRTPTPEEAAALLTALGVVGAAQHRLVELARHADESTWFSVGLHGVTNRQSAVIECERAATSTVDWAPGIVTGLLQTFDYTRSVMLAAGMTPAEAEHAALVRSDRKDVLNRRRPLRLHALIGEPALRNDVGSSWVMADQLRHLHEVAEWPNVTVRVVPTNAGWHPGTAGPFVLYDFPTEPSLVYFEHFRSSAFNPDAEDVRAYRDAVDAILEVAHSPGDTRELLAGIAREKERAHEQEHLAQVQPQPAE